MELPTLTLPFLAADWAAHPDPWCWDWSLAARASGFIVADGSAVAQQQTYVRAAYDAQQLYLRFDCDDRDIWAQYSERDQPLYDEEVVEVFLSPGADQPTRYYEFEVSPAGVVFDAIIANPHSRRVDMTVDLAWNPPIRWLADWPADQPHWAAILVIPWACVCDGPPPNIWRVNLFRIERPRDAAPEFSCWSPTLTEPADFHQPARFGFFRLGA